MSLPQTSPATSDGLMYVTSARSSSTNTTFSMPQQPTVSTGFVIGVPTITALDSLNMDIDNTTPMAVNMTGCMLGSGAPHFSGVAVPYPGVSASVSVACMCPSIPSATCSNFVLPTTSTPSATAAGEGITLPSIYTSACLGTAPVSLGCAQNLVSAAVKENELPQEIMETVNVFKKFVLAQKELSSEIAMNSMESTYSIKADIDSTKNYLYSLSLDVTAQTTLASKLKLDIAQCLRDAEMARRTHNTSIDMQSHNTAPLRYFQQLTMRLQSEVDMIISIIEEAKKHLQTSQPTPPFTPGELHQSLRSITDSLIHLAAHVQSLHTSAQETRQQYHDLRRRFLQDSGSQVQRVSQEHPIISGMHLGPTPFSAIGMKSGFSLQSSSAAEMP